MMLLKKIGKISTGNTPSKKHREYYNSDDIGFVKPDSISDTVITEINKTSSFISENAREKARVASKGSILITCIGSVGKVGIVTEGEYAFNQQINAIMPNEDVNQKYLAYNLLYNKQRLINIANAPVVPIVNKTQLENFEINFDSNIDAQKKIVEQLDGIALVIDKRKKQLDVLDELIKARFVEVFGDPVLNSMKWEEHKLSEYILFMTSGSRGWSKYFTGDGSEVFITIKNVKNNKITLKEIQFVNAPDDKEAKRTKVQAGDLLISITADLGRTGVVSNEIAKQGAYINQHLSLIRLDVSKINPHFVSYYLETEAGKRQFASKNQSAVKAGLSFESIRSLKILVPPMEVQRDYVLFVEQVDKSKLQVYQYMVAN